MQCKEAMEDYVVVCWLLLDNKSNQSNYMEYLCKPNQLVNINKCFFFYLIYLFYTFKWNCELN